MKKVFWIFINLVFFLFVLIRHNCLAVVEEFGFTEKKELIEGSGEHMSQYSPWVIHELGWDSYVMYYCKMSEIDGVWRDRVHRIENWSDGKNKNWQNDRVVIQGELNQHDDLSCSPGVGIDRRDSTNEVWRMYYITAQRGEDCDLYIYHATSRAPGIHWQKKGPIEIDGLDWPIKNCAAETPEAFVINNKIVLFFSGSGGKLHRAESDDGDYFYNHKIINLPDSVAGAGRVFFGNDIFYYVYGRNSKGDIYLPTDQIYILRSLDGINFSSPELLMSSNGEGWDGDRMWSPQLIKSAGEWRVYYAGNIGNYDWFGANSSIGMRSYEDLEEIFETECQPKNGDYNNDGKTDVSDLIAWYRAYKGEYDVKADFNCDEKINIEDLSLWYQSFRSK